ncbi:MAG: hypothetical protein BMS9Abin32_557 [Gammaproteobacteria bacterium]|nr:MAG: hypothetical protein BMS9Abin32_557 [Gammaproteobacteria bacterium]
MANASKGIIAGLVATLVLSLIMVAKGMMGLMPGLNVIAMLSTMMHAGPAVGWIAHFMIGALVWGLGFVALSKFLPGSSSLVQGISFGIAAWLMMMLLVMPMAGAGLFGLKMGAMAPILTLMLHVIYGAVLGGVFGKLSATRAAVAGAGQA